jgi:hypothetical protein
VVALLAIFVARKLHEPANERYHFGYAKYEPLDIARQAVAEGMMLLHPDVDVAVLFRSAPAKPQSAEPPRSPHSQGLATKIEGTARNFFPFFVRSPHAAPASDNEFVNRIQRAEAYTPYLFIFRIWRRPSDAGG